MKENARSKVVSINSKRTTNYDVVSEFNQNVIGARIKEARQSKKISLAGMSEVMAGYGVKIGAAGLGKWERGESVPNAYQLIAVKEALELEDSFAYFMSAACSSALNEEGRNKVAAYRKDLIATGLYRPKKIIDRTIRYIKKPLVDQAASAGTGVFLDEGHYQMADFPENTVPENADFAIRISGDSMEPTYHDGQIVWVQRCEELEPGEVGIFVYDNEGYIKVYDEEEPEDTEEFTDSYGNIRMQPVLVSYNTKYPPKRVSPYAGFRICGRVLS